MKIMADLHCHTVASTHAYSTVKELADEAAKRGLEAVAITDHAPAIPDAPHLWHFENLNAIPRKIGGVQILYGTEANILNLSGEIDMPERVLKKLDIVVASIHTPCYQDSDKPFIDHTSAYLGALDNPYVDIIGHSGAPSYPYDHEVVLKKAKQTHKLIEINAHSFVARKESVPNCRDIAQKCKELEVGIVVNSDAHICFDVGALDDALVMLEELEFPEELIMNTSLKKLEQYLGKKLRIE